jgi:nicotinamidase/pyrazinamidase
VQETAGARFHPQLHVAHAQLVLRKGFNREIDSYSAFQENDRKTPTGLAGYLRERGLTRVFLAGLAFDFCVRYSAEDAKNQGFEPLVIEEACRAINIDGSLDAARKRLAALGIPCISLD